MVLNLLRVEEVNPEIMLEKSFYQFQNYASVPGVIDSKSMYNLAGYVYPLTASSPVCNHQTSMLYSQPFH